MPAKLNCPQKSSLRYSLSYNNQTDEEDETEGMHGDGGIRDGKIVEGEIGEGGCE